MKKSIFRNCVEFLLLAGFAYFGVNKETGKSLLCLGIIVLLVLIEVGFDKKESK